MSDQVLTIHRVALAVTGLVLLGAAGVWARLTPAFVMPLDHSGGLVVRASRPLMGSDFAVSIWVPASRQAEAQDAAEAALDFVAQLETQISEWRIDSQISRLNENAGGEFIWVGKDVAELVTQMRHWAQETNGAFDPTAGRTFELWEQARKDKTVPHSSQIEAALATAGFQHLEVKGEYARLTLPGMRLGTGGIGHGWAADRVSAWLSGRGFADHLVDGSGDIAIHGKRGEFPWVLAIRHPRKKTPWVVHADSWVGGVSTSGDYERFFEIDGRRYSHIIDPRTGWPAEGIAGATVFASTAILADVLATAVCVVGTEAGLGLVESIPGVRAVIVRDNGQVVVSKGLRLINSHLEMVP
ncbi:MAG: FAD:protein FMN transferase [Myxococcales bacterium]|nr:FAD:protein FMN transferase [Myxococcales bacterium]